MSEGLAAVVNLAGLIKHGLDTTWGSVEGLDFYLLLRPSVGGGEAESPLASGLGEFAKKSSGVRVIIAPPAADRSSNHSFGGGSLLKKFAISYALNKTRKFLLLARS
jgi:hypothetical protein